MCCQQFDRLLWYSVGERLFGPSRTEARLSSSAVSRSITHEWVWYVILKQRGPGTWGIMLKEATGPHFLWKHLPLFSIASRSFDPLTQIQCRNVFLYWLNETHMFWLDLCWTFVFNEYFQDKICSLYKNICIFFNSFQIVWLIDSKSIPKCFP